MTTIDPNFEKTEKYLLTEFKKALNGKITFDSNLRRADDLPRNDMFIDTSSAPHISRSSVDSLAKTANFNYSDSQVTTTDPFHEYYHKA